jgi:phosphohistidine phosphatase
MDLYLMRHGDAVDLGDQGAETDEERMLSRRGREQTRQVARGLRVLGCRPQAVFTSPLVRARQTAEIVAQVLGLQRAVKAADVLMPGTPVAEVRRWLGRLRDDSVMLVGHMPDLGVLAGSLVSRSGDVAIAFKKSGICRIEIPRAGRAQGTLEWLAPPALLQRPARRRD